MIRFIGCFIGALMLGYLVNAPKKTILLCAIVGTLGYGVYILSLDLFGSDLLAYFLAICVLTFLSEAMARRHKEPTTIFLCVSVLPLIPGLGLYETMLCIIDADYPGFLQKGTDTLLIIIIICAAMGLSTQVFRILFLRQKRLR